jgi:hypothetical protein
MPAQLPMRPAASAATRGSACAPGGTTVIAAVAPCVERVHRPPTRVPSSSGDTASLSCTALRATPPQCLARRGRAVLIGSARRESDSWCVVVRLDGKARALIGASHIDVIPFIIMPTVTVSTCMHVLSMNEHTTKSMRILCTAMTIGTRRGRRAQPAGLRAPWPWPP